MTVMNPTETAQGWRAEKREASVQLHLSGSDGDAALLAGARVAGLPLSLNIVSTTDWIDPHHIGDALAAVIQVNPDQPASITRFQDLAAATQVPLIAAAFDPPLALVRLLIRSGAHDVVSLPLNVDDLEASIAPLRDEMTTRARSVNATRAKLVTVIKSVGGVGATALLGQLGIEFARNEARHGREVCLLDLDLQFGDLAFQLGLDTSLTIADLLAAGSRLDGDLLRSTILTHSSGLKVITAPPMVMPLDTATSDQMFQIVDLAQRDFGTVFVDLPTNWTNWSLSLLARSDVVLLFTELSVSGLNRAKRQLDLIAAQDLDNIDLRVVVNRFDKSLLKTIRASDVRDALGRDIAYTVSNDPVVMRAAIEQGIPISEVKRKSAVGKDIAAIDAGLAASLGLER
jgi:pilus assembly protein CpaE